MAALDPRLCLDKPISTVAERAGAPRLWAQEGTVALRGQGQGRGRGTGVEFSVPVLAGRPGRAERKEEAGSLLLA